MNSPHNPKESRPAGSISQNSLPVFLTLQDSPEVERGNPSLGAYLGAGNPGTNKGSALLIYNMDREKSVRDV